ncbi:MAG TPA: hydrogenase maturation protease [Spirochaetota bacterium]|jgi:hydrogenase maturation protease|nr:hydrogenase maturation protease [Spirochaetota bacterium]
MSSILSDIREVVRDNCCLVGMGNYLKSDDAVGLYIIESVKKIADNKSAIFNVEDIIEAYVFKIAESDFKNILIIDAVKTDAEVGSVVFGKLEDEFDELGGTLSTHKLALKMSGSIFREHNKETYLLGVVVDNVDFGAELSTPVRESADMLINLIIDVLNCNKGVSK